MLFSISGAEDITEFFESIVKNLDSLIRRWYEALISRQKLETTVNEIKVQNRNLSKLLKQNFNIKPLWKFFFNKVSSDIRKNIGEMQL